MFNSISLALKQKVKQKVARGRELGKGAFYGLLNEFRHTGIMREFCHLPPPKTIVDPEVARSLDARVTKIELRGACPHLFLITEDEMGTVVEHHWFEEGFEAKKIRDKQERLKRQRLWKRVEVKEERICVRDVKESIVMSGSYRLFSNNCLHAVNRVVCKAQ